MKTLGDLPIGTQVYLHERWWVVTRDTASKIGLDRGRVQVYDSHLDRGRVQMYNSDQHDLGTGYYWATADIPLNSDEVGRYDLPPAVIQERPSVDELLEIP